MKPEKSDSLYVEHMLSCIRRVNEYTNGSRERFFQSELVQDAVIRNLQTFAESSQRLSDDLKTARPRIPWREISGFRNILVHDYLGVDLKLVWGIVERDLPALKTA
ncbi:MAG: DUF86 domain-containing protein [Pseudomonadota bacterium]|nr:DUF86 domain-containing protein [Pseudomonadota bacterium]